MGRLDGRVALITGSGNGQGRAEASLFAREGAKVAVADVRDDDGRRVVAEIKEAGGEATFFHLDVTSPEEWDQVVEQIVATYGKLNILVNNAGISGSSQDDLMGEEGWDLLMKVNSRGPFLGVRCVIPRLIEAGGGSIVNISSTAGLVGSEGARHPAYSASKGGVRLMTKRIAAQFAKDNIRCNSIHPGMMPPMTSAKDTNREASTGVFDRIPMGRSGRVEELANAVLFMACDDSSYVTGTELIVEGGMTCI